MKPTWETNDGAIRLYCADCLDVLPTLEAGSVGAVICDPPFGRTACDWDIPIPFSEMWPRLDRLVRPSVPVVLFAQQPFTSALIMSQLDQFKYSWVWDKGQISNFQNAKRQPLTSVEDICVFGKGETVYNPQGLSSDIQQTVKRRGNWEKTLSAKKNLGHMDHSADYQQEMTGYPHSLIFFAKGRNDIVHPTEKPVPLMEYLVRTYSDSSEIVLDFTAGSGTTGVACVRTGRRFIGIEKEERYFDIAVRRIEAELNRFPLLDPKQPTQGSLLP